MILKHIGQITINEVIDIGDPCYSIRVDEDNCYILDMHPGIYNAYILESDEDSWGIRNAQFAIIHSDYKMTVCDDPRDIFETLIKYDFLDVDYDILNLPVDSGTMSIGLLDSFDADASYEQYYNKVSFDEGYKILSDSITVRAGFGDGSYPLDIIQDTDLIIGAKITFI